MRELSPSYSVAVLSAACLTRGGLPAWLARGGLWAAASLLACTGSLAGRSSPCGAAAAAFANCSVFSLSFASTSWYTDPSLSATVCAAPPPAPAPAAAPANTRKLSEISLAIILWWRLLGTPFVTPPSSPPSSAPSHSARIESICAVSMPLNEDGGWVSTGPTIAAVPFTTRNRTPIDTPPPPAATRALPAATAVAARGSGSNPSSTRAAYWSPSRCCRR